MVTLRDAWRGLTGTARVGRVSAVLVAALMTLMSLTASVGMAATHPMPTSLVLLDIGSAGVHASLRLPIDKLEIGYGRPLQDDPARRVAAERERLRAYIASHIRVTSPDGRPWGVRVTEVVLVPEDTIHTLGAEVQLRAPSGTSPRAFTLHYDVIQHQLITHKILVSLRSDWDDGRVTAEPELLGTMGYGADTLVVARPTGSAWNGFASVVRLGVHHIAEGSDHLLFLLTLLLPVAQVARDGRWRDRAPPRRSMRSLVLIVTAFTVGHSITLAAGVLGWAAMPAASVEILIAASILVSAVHAIRPVFPRREALVAGAFGLVDALAFATIVTELGLGGRHVALTVLGFNLGIELMQLAVVAVTVPWLLLVGRTRAYPAYRVAGAGVAAVAATAWLAERAVGVTNPVSPYVDAVASHPVEALALLAALATGTWLRDRRRGPRPGVAWGDRTA